MASTTTTTTTTTTRPPNDGDNEQIELIPPTTTTTGERLEPACLLHTADLTTLTENSAQNATKWLKADTAERVKPTPRLATTIDGVQFDCFDDDDACRDFCKFDVLDSLELLLLKQSGVPVCLPADSTTTTTTSTSTSSISTSSRTPGPGLVLQNGVSFKTASDNRRSLDLDDQRVDTVNSDHTHHYHQKRKNDTPKTARKKAAADDPMAVVRRSRRRQGQLAVPYRDQFTYSLDFLDDKNFGKQWLNRKKKKEKHYDIEVEEQEQVRPVVIVVVMVVTFFCLC